MAIIGKIRNRMGVLLVVVVGVPLFVFIMSSLFEGAGMYFLTGDRNLVGTINGNKVKIEEYDNRLKRNQGVYSQMNNAPTIENDVLDQINDQTWQELVDMYVVDDQYAKLGIKVSDAEFKDLTSGNFKHPLILQFFRNQQGMFDPNLMTNYINFVNTEESAVNEEQLPQWRTERARWVEIEKLIMKDRMSTKYTSLISKGLYVTSKEINNAMAENADKAQFRYVSKNYGEISDSTLQITDEDLKKAYDEFKFRFRTPVAIRSVKYAVFEVLPTRNDSLAIYQEVAKIKTEFETSTDDTSFVLKYSDKGDNPAYYRKEKLSRMVDSMLFNAANGTIFGPYIESNAYTLAKRMGEKTSSDSLKLSAILIARMGQDGKEKPSAKKLSDSLMAALKAGDSFELLAARHSEDPTSAKDSGRIGWAQEPIGPNPLVDTAYATPIGEYRVVNLPDAIAIIRVAEKSAPTKKVKVAFVLRAIEPSKDTENSIFQKASDFAANNKTADDFEKSAKSGQYVIRDDRGLRDNARTIMGIEDSRKLVKWAYEANVGDVTKDIEKYGNKFVVAILTRALEPGVPAFNDIKKDLEPYAKRNVKAAKFIEEMKAAASSGNIDAAAATLKTRVQPATDITFSAYGVPGAGFEPALVGAAFGSAQGKLSPPFKGNYGVYMIVTDAVNKVQQPPMDMNQIRMQMAMMMGQRAQSEAVEALKDLALIRDMRYKFYY
jgi:peptidyl-prolyl cis-trans isomerase D